MSNNNSHEAEDMLRSFHLSAPTAFWWKQYDPTEHSQGGSASRCGCHWEAPGINRIHAKQEGFGMKGFTPDPCSPFKLHIERCKILHRGVCMADCVHSTASKGPVSVSPLPAGTMRGFTLPGVRGSAAPSFVPTHTSLPVTRRCQTAEANLGG